MTLRKPIANSAILIAGMARDVAPFIGKEIEALVACTNGFKSATILVVESDSSDSTLYELDLLKTKYNNLNYISLGNLSSRIVSRTQRIAHCRNQVIDALQTNPAYADIDFVMLADLDGLNSLLSPNKISQCWGVDEDWDAIFANQEDHYYDIYALRHADWSPCNCSEQQLNLEPVLGRGLAHHLAIGSKQIYLPKKLGLIEVDSAFGGLGIYKKEAFISATYIGSEDGKDICEHVPFHRSLKKKGYRLFINAALTNCVEPINTSESAKKRPILKIIKKVGRALLGRSRFDKYLDFLKK
jgi:glycosyltransferase involved in cell wall biosynthesis